MVVHGIPWSSDRHFRLGKYKVLFYALHRAKVRKLRSAQALAKSDQSSLSTLVPQLW